MDNLYTQNLKHDPLYLSELKNSFRGHQPSSRIIQPGVPFSNNKLFWYLLSEAGVTDEKRDELRDDEAPENRRIDGLNLRYQVSRSARSTS